MPTTEPTYNVTEYVIEYRRKNDTEWVTWAFVSAEGPRDAQIKARPHLPASDKRMRIQFRLIQRDALITDTVLVEDL